ncbi:hypothetical protein MBANPS3_002107 [Mucor bainieri]
MDTYSRLHAEFPPDVSSLTSTPRAKHLRFLHLHNCKIPEDYFTKLSCQLEHVDQLKYSAPNKVRLQYPINSDNASKIRIHLPYTAVDTIDLSDLKMTAYTSYQGLVRFEICKV